MFVRAGIMRNDTPPGIVEPGVPLYGQFRDYPQSRRSRDCNCKWTREAVRASLPSTLKTPPHEEAAST